MSALVPKVTRELTRMRRTLRETFGLDKLRPGQAEVIRSVLEGNNTLAIMPTGAGKSLCYQLPSLHLPGTTVVVSPLISLMKDQVDKLEEAGIEAAQLNSSLTTEEHEENLEQIKTEKSDFIFVTPERFTNQEFLSDLRKPFSLQPFEVRIDDRTNQNAPSSTTAQVNIFPLLRIGSYLFF